MKAILSADSHAHVRIAEQRPRKLPRQQRARLTFESALDATEDLLTRHGVSMLTTNHVAERAGISIGSLYQYFPNKAALLQTVWQRHVAAQIQVVERVAGSDAPSPLDTELRLIVHEAILLHTSRLKLHRELSEFTRRSDLPTWYSWLMDRRNAAMRRLLERHCGELASSSDLDTRSTIICDLSRSLINTSVDSSRRSLDETALEDAILTMMLAYLHKSPH